MITKGADALIIAAIDGTALSRQLNTAGSADIPVIAYDRLIRESENVDFYVTFDNYNVGRAAGDLAARRPRPRGGAETGEGPVQRRAVRRFPRRQQRVLLLERRDRSCSRYLDSGEMVVPSGPDRHRAGRHPAVAAGDSPEAHGGPADQRLRRRNVPTACSPPTTACRGHHHGAAERNGYGSTVEDGLPVVTGQDAEIQSVKSDPEGEQNSTVFKDTRELADQATCR
jgi:putative multiple sugar transport system substrate-binding protein